MSETSKKRVPFPVSLPGLLGLGLAAMIVNMTVRDVMFQSHAEPVMVRTLSDVKKLTDNSPVEVHLPLDLKDVKTFSFRRGGTFAVIAFEGTGRQLFYAIKHREDTELKSQIEPPIRGRAEGKDFGGLWNISPVKSVRLSEVFDGEVPETALVVRPEEREGVSWLQWIGTVISVLALGWSLLAVVAWMFGINLAADSSETAPATAGSEPETGRDPEASPNAQ